MRHKWFSGFDWDGLIGRTCPVPIDPGVKGDDDTSNFDDYPEEDDVPEDCDWGACMPFTGTREDLSDRTLTRTIPPREQTPSSDGVPHHDLGSLSPPALKRYTC